MLLIQTALEQEFRAVALALDGADMRPRERARSGAPIFGRIEQHCCCVVKTGVGLRLAEQTLLKTLEHIERPQLVLSIGLAGALVSQLEIGQRRLVSSVTLGEREPHELRAALHLLTPEYRRRVAAAALVSVDRPLLTAQAKQQFERASLASLCDMETHAVARLAVARGVPWLGARIVSDSAGETLAPWILKLPQLIQRRAWGGLARELATHPQDLRGLLRLAVRMKTLERQLAQFTVELIRNVVRS
jgi:nucleoside phosphorylase